MTRRLSTPSMKKGQWIGSAIAAGCLAIAGAGALGVRGPKTDAPPNALNRRLLEQINVVRRSHGLHQLKLSAPLSVAAGNHTREMGEVGYFAHASLDHTSFWKRIEREYPSTGYRSWDVGENLLYKGPDVDAAEAMQLWLKSPEHRANLLDPDWREVGIATEHLTAAPGVYEGKAVTILTTDFGVRQ